MMATATRTTACAPRLGMRPRNPLSVLICKEDCRLATAASGGRCTQGSSTAAVSGDPTPGHTLRREFGAGSNFASKQHRFRAAVRSPRLLDNSSRRRAGSRTSPDSVNPRPTGSSIVSPCGTYGHPAARCSERRIAQALGDHRAPEPGGTPRGIGPSHVLLAHTAVDRP